MVIKLKVMIFVVKWSPPSMPPPPPVLLEGRHPRVPQPPVPEVEEGGQEHRRGAAEVGQRVCTYRYERHLLGNIKIRLN